MTAGRLILIVGPSGVGKDTLIDFARSRLQDDEQIQFVRRAITRPTSAGEEHEPLDEAAFDRRLGMGDFALHWAAHDVRYGIPADIDDWLADGWTVVVNGSRQMIPLARVRYPRLELIAITASADVLAQRLRARGREDEAAIQKRLTRSAAIDFDLTGASIIDNSGDIAIGGMALVAALRGVPVAGLEEDAR